ncbi:hypothetical protein, partial [Leisingera sp. ANG-S5]|uniref:hypothetical protein n=1 Tax=Leisingera sp. ANG-S5 TaxID=1577901 RepID=UPI00187BE9F3
MNREETDRLEAVDFASEFERQKPAESSQICLNLLEPFPAGYCLCHHQSAVFPRLPSEEFGRCGETIRISLEPSGEFSASSVSSLGEQANFKSRTFQGSTSGDLAGLLRLAAGTEGPNTKKAPDGSSEAFDMSGELVLVAGAGF